jgi:hypothetical protein
MNTSCDAECESTEAQHRGLCGWALVLAHANSGDAAIISGYAAPEMCSRMPSENFR